MFLRDCLATLTRHYYLQHTGRIDYSKYLIVTTYTYADLYTMSGAYVAPFGEVTLAGLRACSSKDVKPVGCQ